MRHPILIEAFSTQLLGERTSGAKARVDFASLMARLEVVPLPEPHWIKFPQSLELVLGYTGSRIPMSRKGGETWGTYLFVAPQSEESAPFQPILEHVVAE